ncbi:hypothetical protein PBI_EDMUNDO_76 [Arthrobacter phage Edmundo]|nr:hypothetical protein PBI_EDMUNDO_76 [Arthrobacter phage Edmundo]
MIRVELEVMPAARVAEDAVSASQLFPFPPRVGDALELESTGQRLTVKTATWMIPDHGDEEIYLHVRLI